MDQTWISKRLIGPDPLIDLFTSSTHLFLFSFEGKKTLTKVSSQC